MTFIFFSSKHRMTPQKKSSLMRSSIRCHAVCWGFSGRSSSPDPTWFFSRRSTLQFRPILPLSVCRVIRFWSRVVAWRSRSCRPFSSMSNCSWAPSRIRSPRCFNSSIDRSLR
ncbi:hypothetical protein AB205_0169960 [Aquarana catesbeiana]|uniref:Uncharacterized protein n=1 Tax=Aquarana catesbeiana TaxID=8400 RepID=A0A2G9RCM7_AQUCT|nr:hypothetical protein AB205_0169960 [Aquarana catesbeiana]